VVENDPLNVIAQERPLCVEVRARFEPRPSACAEVVNARGPQSAHRTKPHNSARMGRLRYRLAVIRNDGQKASNVTGTITP
jgi:uncharacterized protein (DUF1684 family)